MFKSTMPVGRSRPSLPDLDLIANKTRLVVRQSRKFTPGGFLQTLLSSVVTGHASFNQLAGGLKQHVSAPMARQSLYERLGDESTAFLLNVLFDLIEQRYQPAASVLRDGPIRRIIIEDSSSQVMPKSNSQEFPAHGNRHGDTAGVKIDFAYDILTGNIISHSLQPATEQDKLIGKELICEIQRGDLVLRDMGYFILTEFTAIEEREAFWLTRLPLTTGITLDNGVSLEKHLKKFQGDIIDIPVIAGKEECKKCRLVAMRAAPEVAEARRAERRKQAHQKGKEACAAALIRDGWHLMLTNLNKDQASVSQLAAIYRSRWAIEIQFRAWKQSLDLTKALNRKSNTHHLHALALAGMIAHQLGMKIAQRISSAVGRDRLSYEKLYDLLAVCLVKASGLAEVFAFDPDPRHVTRDRRTRKSPVESGILALT